MLGSITPLGERGRGSRWWLTVSAYLVGSLGGGVLVGWALGALGAALGVASLAIATRLAVIALALLLGLALDLGVVGLRLPTVHRQVEEEWRARYRGWVWGLSFGFQLALGVVTIVTTSTVYVTWVAAGLSGAAFGGAAIGATFGLARALPVFSVARVRTPAQLLRVDGALQRLARPARRTTYAVGGALAAIAALGAAR
jgi:hypothetical protein